MTMCALLKNLLPYLFSLSVILATALLSMVLYDQLLLLGYSATGVTALFCFFFCSLVVAQQHPDLWQPANISTLSLTLQLPQQLPS